MAEAVLEQQKSSGGGGVAVASKAIINGRLGQFQATAALNAQQKKFVYWYVRNGGNGTQACKNAGYSAANQVTYLLSLPHVRNSIRIEREKLLESRLPTLGIRVIEQMLEDQDTSQAVRAKLAMWCVDRAHPAKQQQLADSKKPIHEMSVEELEQFVKKGREALDNIKPALAQPVEIESEIGDSAPPTESDLANSSAKSQ